MSELDVSTTTSPALAMLRGIMRGDVDPPPVAQLIGLRVASISPGHAVMEMEAGSRHHNPMGTLHGGILCDLADAAMGFAFAATLGPGEQFTTVELKMNFLRQVREAKLSAAAHVLKAGRTLSLVECDITDEDGKLVGRSSSTVMTIRKQSADQSAR